jgi:sulfoxide reductase heme-binding subunit YedZ
VHWAAYFSWPVAVAHTLGMGTDMRLDWALALVAACIAAVVGATGWRVAVARRAGAARPVTAVRARRSLRLRPGAGVLS